MNKHIFLDTFTVSLAALMSGKKKFFAESLHSSTFEEQLASLKLKMPPLAGEGVYEIEATASTGKLDPAFYIAQWKGKDYPMIIYHHGNNERPFDFKKSAKNTFYHIFLDSPDSFAANLIVVRAPFHNASLGYYQDQMVKLSHFMAMIATSVKLNEAIIHALRGLSEQPILTSGISLGGWVTNLHRGIYNSSTAYVPLLSGAYLGELFLRSRYKRMTSRLALEHPEVIRALLNFDRLFKRHQTPNVFPLLAIYDQFITYEVQKATYDGHPLKTIACGHVSGALRKETLRNHLLSVLQML